MSDESKKVSAEVVAVIAELQEALSFLSEASRNYGYFGGASLREMLVRRIGEIGSWDRCNRIPGTDRLTKMSELLALQDRLLGHDGVKGALDVAEEIHGGGV